MAPIPHVQPGEVIRSNFINGLIDAINAFGTGVAPGVLVPDVFGLTLNLARTTLSQPSVNLALGTTLDTFGVTVDPNASSSGSRIVIGQAPPAGLRVPVGTAVNLIVAAEGGSTLPIGGNVDVTFESLTPLTPVAGSPVTFRYGVTSRANQTATFTISPTVAVASNQAQWQSALQVLDDATEQPLPGAGLLLAANQTRFVKVRITSVPAAPPNAQFTLTVSADAAGVVAHADSRTFTVGQATPPQDATIDVFDVINAVPPVNLVGATVQLAVGGGVRINCRVHFTVAGTYDVTAAVVSGTNWTADRNPGSTPASYTINASDLGTPAAFQFPEFIIRAANVNPSATGSAELRIKRQGQTALRTRVLGLQLTA